MKQAPRAHAFVEYATLEPVVQSIEERTRHASSTEEGLREYAQINGDSSTQRAQPGDSVSEHKTAQRDAVDAIMLSLVQPDRTTSHSSIISTYSKSFLGDSPRCLLLDDYTVTLVIRILKRAAKRVRLDDKLHLCAAQLLGHLCAKGWAIAPDALQAICDIAPPSARLVRDHVLTLLCRLPYQSTAEGHVEDQRIRDLQNSQILGVVTRLLEASWTVRDHAAVSRMNARLRRANIPFVNLQQCLRVVQSEFSLFDAMKNNTTHGTSHDAWRQHQSFCVHHLFDAVSAVLKQMDERHITVDKHLRSVLARGFFSVVDFATKHPVFHDYGDDALDVLRVLRGTIKPGSDPDSSSSSAMFELAWADALVKFRAVHGIHKRPHRRSPSPKANEDEDVYSYRQAISTVIEQLWKRKSGSSVEATNQRHPRPYHGPHIPGVEISCHRLSILIRHSLLSGETHPALEHYHTLDTAAAAFANSIPPSRLQLQVQSLPHRDTSLTQSEHDRLLSATLTDIQKRQRSVYIFMLTHALSSLSRSLTQHTVKGRVVPPDRGTAATQFRFLVDVLRLRARGMHATWWARAEAETFSVQVWAAVLRFIRTTWPGVPWDTETVVERAGEELGAIGRAWTWRVGMRAVFQILLEEVEVSVAREEATTATGSAPAAPLPLPLPGHIQHIRSNIMKDGLPHLLALSAEQWASSSSSTVPLPLLPSHFPTTPRAHAPPSASDIAASLDVLARTFTALRIDLSKDGLSREDALEAWRARVGADGVLQDSTQVSRSRAGGGIKTWARKARARRKE